MSKTPLKTIITKLEQILVKDGRMRKSEFLDALTSTTTYNKIMDNNESGVKGALDKLESNIKKLEKKAGLR